MSTELRRLGLCVAVCALFGCGKPLATGEYKGEPMLQLEGQIRLSAALHNEPWLASEDLRVALFWIGALSESGLYNEDEGRVGEQPKVTRGVFPARYSMSLFLPPADEVLRPVKNGEGRLGMALMLLYRDTNGNGVWDRTRENLAGGTGDYILVYTPEGASGGNLEKPLKFGYHLVRLNNTERCLDKTSNALELYSVTKGTEVDLTITRDVGQIMPDIDCNGVIDTCQDYIDRASDAQSEEEQNALLDAYRECTHDLFDDDPFLAEEECFALFEQVESEGGEVPEEIRDVYDRCEEALGGPGEDLACDGFLTLADLCSFEGDEECIDFAIAVYEICLQHESDDLDECRDFFDAFDNAEFLDDLDGDFWFEFASCLIDAEEGPEFEDECFERELAVCEQRLAEFEQDDEITDDEWVLFERCYDKIFETCQIDEEEPCEEVLDDISECEGDPDCEEFVQNDYDVCVCVTDAFETDCGAIEACRVRCYEDDDICHETIDEVTSLCESENAPPPPPIDPDLGRLPDQCADICLAALDAPSEKARLEALQAFEDCLDFHDISGKHECR